jgi:hypothetical protein
VAELSLLVKSVRWEITKFLIPKEFHDQITKLEGKQVRIIIDDKI